MLRTLLAVCVLTSVAHADADRTLPVDAVTKGAAGDWSIYEGQIRHTGKLVPDRKVVALGSSPGAEIRVIWFRGAKDKEAPLWADKFATTSAIGVGLLGYGASKVRSWATEQTTCKLDTAFPCTKLTFTVAESADAKDLTTVTLKMSDRVRATGIVELEATDRTGVAWKLHVVGYGRAGKTEWGVGTKARLEIDGDDDDLLVGVEINGGFGYGRSGFGPGGGGTGWGTIGTGGYGTLGVRGTTSRVPQVSLGIPTTRGGDLDKAIIRRYLKRNIMKITYCYEKQLLAKPRIWGTMTVKFRIEPTGKVGAATAVGVDPVVSSCVAGVVRAIELPKPRDGKALDVAYPLTFHPPTAKKP